MADSRTLVDSPIGVSSDCLFNLKSTCAPSRSLRTNLPSINGSTFLGGSSSIFYVPAGRRGTFLDGNNNTYLKFTVVNNDNTVGNAMFIDNSAYSFINRIDIGQSSNSQLETIQQANVLQNYLLDFGCIPSAKQGLSSCYGTTSGITLAQASTNDARQGNVIYGGANSQKLTFCIPLIGSAIFSSCDSLFPLCILNDDLKIEITWELNNLACCYAALPAGNWSIVNPELVVNIIEIGEQGMEIINNATPLSNTIYIHGSSWKHYTANLPGLSQGQFSFPISARFSSLKSLVILPRRNTETTNGLAYSIGSRINPNISQFFLRCGSYMIPSKPITLQNAVSCGGYGEAYSELLKSFHSLSTPQYSAGMPFQYYCIADAVDNSVGGGINGVLGGVTVGSTLGNSFKNGFALAVELEVFLIEIVQFYQD